MDEDHISIKLTNLLELTLEIISRLGNIEKIKLLAHLIQSIDLGEREKEVLELISTSSFTDKTSSSASLFSEEELLDIERRIMRAKKGELHSTDEIKKRISPILAHRSE